MILVGGLTGAGCVVYRYLFQPLWARTDDLSLALRVEEQYPNLNDCLASTVQFIEESETDLDRSSSASLRREAVHRALQQAEGCNFNRVVDSRGLGMAGLSMLVGCRPGHGSPSLLPFPGPDGVAAPDEPIRRRRMAAADPARSRASPFAHRSQ